MEDEAYADEAQITLHFGKSNLDTVILAVKLQRGAASANGDVLDRHPL